MPRPLLATYRLQFNPAFTFADAEALVPYLRRLGVSHAYASPIFVARPGSEHGYDVVDPRRVNPELGGEAGLRSFAGALHREGLGLILDIVPNHMASHATNAAWTDMLTFGRGAPTARTFDIAWSRGHVLLPVLDRPLKEAIADGLLRLERDGDSGILAARFHEHVLPLRPGSVRRILEAAGLEEAATAWRAADTQTLDTTTAEVAKARLRTLEPAQVEALDDVLRTLPLAPVLNDQHWRLMHWRSARKRLSHRRFFNINELVGVRVEDPAVFRRTHALILSLVADGTVDGLRVDHIDGLADPAGYCRRLRAAVGREVPIFVEKILEDEERLRPWPVQGTTGYERLVDINGVFVAEEGRARLAGRLAATGLVEGEPEARLAAAKRQVLTESFGSEVEQLVGLASAALKRAGVTTVTDPDAVRDGFLALVVHCPVYRSYATARGHDAEDEAIWATTLARIAAAETPETRAVATRLLDLVAGDRPEAREMRVRFQQLTGPAMAKGLEDTELYRSVGLISLNEVGASPDRHGLPIADFHRRVADGTAMVPLATHDTKLGSDARARLNTLSLDPEAWIAAFERWTAAHAPLRGDLDGAPVPDALDEWRLYQVLFAIWPIDRERLVAHLLKALREGKRHTRWEAPNAAYEEPAAAFAVALLDNPQAAPFREEIARLVEAWTLATRTNGIAQTILQLTIPGIPDIYRGSELWDPVLADPDNRRPVDWAARQAAIDAPRPPLAEDGSGIGRLDVLRRLLAFRREAPALFLKAGYEPLSPPDAPERWLAFLRRGGATVLAVAVPTRPPSGAGADGPAIGGLPPGRYRDILDDRELTVGEDGTARLARDWPFLVAHAL